MAKKPYVRIILYSVTAVLLGVLAIQTSSARERSGRHPAPGLAQPPAPAPAKHREAGSKGRKDIDMPISVRRGGESGRNVVAPAQNTLRIVPPAHPPARAALIGSNVVHRNAIGLQATRREAIQVHNANVQSFAHPPLPAAASASGIAAFATRGLGGPRTMALSSSPTLTTLSRGAIGGSVLTRRGAPLSGLGGPARTLAGISGSAIRPKR
jgi:hypothetical protein